MPYGSTPDSACLVSGNLVLLHMPKCPFWRPWPTCFNGVLQRNGQAGSLQASPACPPTLSKLPPHTYDRISPLSAQDPSRLPHSPLQPDYAPKEHIHLTLEFRHASPTPAGVEGAPAPLEMIGRPFASMAHEPPSTHPTHSRPSTGLYR